MCVNGLFIICLLMCAGAMDEIYYPNNSSRSRTTVSGIAEYRSALTLDWLAAEDTRQRELALAFETEAAPSVQVIASDCISYPKPASGKVARLMLELLKNLEGDEGVIIPELVQALVRAKLLVETSMLEAEPDLESLVKTPDVMLGEPHTTFPRILAMVWMAASDPNTVNKNGWCPVSKVAKYLVMSSPSQTARHMRNLDPVIARARFIMEEFIQHVTPNMYDKKNHQVVRTTVAIQARQGSRSSFHLHARPKVRPHWLKGFSTTSPKASTDSSAEYEEHKHLLVNEPILDDEKKTAGNLQSSMYLLFCEFAAILFTLVRL